MFIYSTTHSTQTFPLLFEEEPEEEEMEEPLDHEETDDQASQVICPSCGKKLVVTVH